jgi:hypothetical protein
VWAEELEKIGTRPPRLNWVAQQNQFIVHSPVFSDGDDQAVGEGVIESSELEMVESETLYEPENVVST